MNKRRFFFILFWVVLAVMACNSSLAVSSSASYRLSVDTVDAGGAAATSASYIVLGKAQARNLVELAGANFKIGQGFVKSAYFSQVILAPLITAFTPSEALNNQSVSATITGANFVSGASLKLSLTGAADITATNVQVSDTSTITALFDITDAVAGLWTVTVTNPDGRSASLPSALNITYPSPVVSAVTPDKGNNNEVVSITNLAGSYFRSGAVVTLSKAGESDITADSVVVVSQNQITCQLNLTSKAIGAWDVKVANSDGQSGVLYGGFKIEAPEIEIVAPVINDPNPFNPLEQSTVISYSLSKDADIWIYIYNIRGKRVWEWHAPAGSSGGSVGQNEVEWKGLTAFQEVAGSGVYIVHVVTKVDGKVKLLSKNKIAVIK